ncbi:MAG: hypothetical protein ACJ780_17445 [Solirubrobacteraceae bacterium]
MRKESVGGDVLRRSARWARRVIGLWALLIAAGIAGCGESPTPPNAVVQDYLNALGAGSFTTACAMMDAGARQATLQSMHVRVTCPSVFRRCLPNRVLSLKRDQTQLLYANMKVSLSSSGTVARVTTSGTPVAGELKQVTLRHQRGGWKLTSFGEAIERCHLTARHARRKQRR